MALWACGGTHPLKHFFITYLFFLFLITSRRQGSSFPSRFDLLRFPVPLHAEVQLSDSLEETIEVEDVRISEREYVGLIGNLALLST